MTKSVLVRVVGMGRVRVGGKGASTLKQGRHARARTHTKPTRTTLSLCVNCFMGKCLTLRIDASRKFCSDCEHSYQAVKRKCTTALTKATGCALRVRWRG